MTTDSCTTVNIRAIPEADIDQALDLSYLVFHVKASEKARRHDRDILLGSARIGAYDGDRLAGQIAAYPLTLSVPGGRLPCAALDFVSVVATHRRRGLLTSMFDEVWRGCADAGQVLSCLWASESAIYGRFGYASAGETCRIEIDSSRPLALRIAPDTRPLRLIDPADAPALAGPLFDAHLAHRAGRVVRDEAWWRKHVLHLDGGDDEDDDGFGPPRVVVLGAPGEPVGGYAVYRTRGPGESPGAVLVRELEADGAPATAALWSYLASIDLTTTVRGPFRPADDPLLLLAADRDQVRATSRTPGLWIRLVDVHAALTARSWAAPVDLVLDLRDTAVPANAGRFRLTAGPDGSSWTPTDEAADLALDVRELAACYPGGTRLAHLVYAGLVTEHTPGAARSLDAALATEWLPATGEY
ncbi:GNAT family N-acetyltransferase [Streptomyces celluloflavus]|uniref:GNAT family N-acetyltransferase n=1 Tax=Streptomyces celluloflavus TaxID=58344 RepID=UPI00368562D0